MKRPGQDLSDEVKKFDAGVPCDVTGQVKHKIFDISINDFPPQNAENKRISSL